MEVTGVIVLFILLAPACRKLVKSVAYRIRAAGEADIIRAKRGPKNSDKPKSTKRKNDKAGKGSSRGKQRRHG